MTDTGHVPVMLEEVVGLLSPAAGGVYVDATAGLGGHAAAIGARLGPGGVVVLNDVDEENLARAGARVAETGVRVECVRGNFAELPYRVQALGLKADMLLADLGFASTQVDNAARGLSFRQEGPLDMRLDPRLKVTAADLVASLSEAELQDIIRRYGEDRQAGRIARKLVQVRSQGPIVTTTQLADVVRSVCGRGAPGQIDPATRTFQALRIAVNDEIGSLEALLASIVRETESLSQGRGAWLAPGARVGFIAFHSLEDRPVKQAFQRMVGLGATALTEGAVTAGEAEQSANPRSRSAKLRVARLPGTTKEV